MEKNNKDQETLVELLNKKSELIKSIGSNQKVKILEVTEELEKLDQKIMLSIRSTNYTVDEF